MPARAERRRPPRGAIAHHAAFDVAFLCVELTRAGIPLDGLPYLCTATLPKLLGFEHPTRRLAWACERYGITLSRPHAALADADASLQLYRRYLDAAAGADLASLASTSSDDACVRSWALAPFAGPSGTAERGSVAILPRAAESVTA
jgi:DNA polymerase III epsilon subunit-like protein